MNQPVQDNTAAPQASFLRTVRAVAWSFVGIRKGSEYRKDLASVNPFHVIAVGLAGAALLALALVALVNWVVAH